MRMRYRGSCHCGQLAFEVEGDDRECDGVQLLDLQRKGSLLWFVPRDQLRLATPEEESSTYTFNKHVIKHRFCPTCGIHPFGEGVDPKGNRDGGDQHSLPPRGGGPLKRYPVNHFDGRSALETFCRDAEDESRSQLR